MLGFHRLVAGRYFTHGTRRGMRVFKLSMALALLLAVTVGINQFLLHAHSVRIQEFRADYGQIFQLTQLILILLFVLVTFFALLILRLTIFTTLSVFGLFIGSGALVIVLSVMSGFEQDLKRKILGTNAHIVVTHHDLPFTDFMAVRDKIAAVPGVIGASPYSENEVMIASQSNLSGVVVKGIDATTVGQVTDLPRTIEAGGLEFLTSPDKLKVMGGPPIFKDKDADPDEFDTVKDDPSNDKKKEAVELVPERRPVQGGVIIGRELARNLRLYPGDDVNIISPFGGIGPSGAIPKSKPFRVAGVFFSGMFEYDTKYVYLSLPAAQKFFDQTGRATGIEAKVANPDETEPVVARIRQALGDGYEVQDWKDLNKSLFSALKIEKILMFVLLCFIILVAAFSIIANGTMLVMEKGREIAILKAMGASDLGILGTFLLLGLFIGSLGTITGMVAGVVGCLALGRFGLPLNPEVYYITTLPVKMNGLEIIAVAVAALFIALAATLYPAWMAARLSPVEGLRDAQR